MRKVREGRKETADEVAEALNMSPDLLDKKENGECNFEVGVLFELCAYYEVNIEEVV